MIQHKIKEKTREIQNWFAIIIALRWRADLWDISNE